MRDRTPLDCSDTYADGCVAVPQCLLFRSIGTDTARSNQMVPKAFLSLAAEDVDFVERVYRHLPHGQAFFFKQSFANGSLMLDVMERDLSNTQLFVLFASQISLAKTWVNFEIERARLARINGTQKRLQIYPDDTAVSVSDLPEWMRAFWFDKKVRGARDIARLISHNLNALVGKPLAERMYGRGVLQDDLRRRFNAKRRELGGDVNPNIVPASGVEQIGRETIIKNTLPLLSPTLPNIAYGPVLEARITTSIIPLLTLQPRPGSTVFVGAAEQLLLTQRPVPQETEYHTIITSPS